MAYYLGKDVNVYWTTEHERFVVSGTADESNVYIHHNGGFYVQGGSVGNSTSDKRVKDNIETLLISNHYIQSLGV